MGRANSAVGVQKRNPVVRGVFSLNDLLNLKPLKEIIPSPLPLTTLTPKPPKISRRQKTPVQKTPVQKTPLQKTPNIPVTILIHGKLELKSPCFEVVNKLMDKYNIIISHYENDPIHIFHPNITYIKQLQNLRLNNPREKLQSFCLPIINGLKTIKTSYVVIMRTDEYYNLDKFIEAVVHNPGKLVSNNFLFCKDQYYKFHPGDHLLGGQTKDMLSMFEITMMKLSHGIWDKLPEIMLMTSFLQLKGEDIEPSSSIELMKRNTVLVKCDDLEPLQIRDTIHGKNYNKAADIYPLGYCIQSLENL